MGSGLDVTIQLDDAQLEAVLGQASRGDLDLRQPLGEIADEWLGEVQERFAEQRDPLGVPWAKRRRDGMSAEEAAADAARPVLHLTGDLERAVAIEVGSDYARIGVSRSGGPGGYARIHNEGGEIMPKNGRALSFGGRLVSRVVMPKRQYLGFGPAEQKWVEDILGDHLRTMFSGASA